MRTELKVPKGFEDKAIYLAGPMTGLPDFGYPEFRKAYNRLCEHGFTVTSPHLRWDSESEETRAGRPVSVYMSHAFGLLLRCNSIALMPGWARSSGAQKELTLALHSGYSIYYYRPNEEFPLLEIG